MSMCYDTCDDEALMCLRVIDHESVSSSDCGFICVMMRIMCAYVWNGMMWHHVMGCCINEYTYVVGQYEFSDSCKAMMVSLPRGLC